MVAMWAIPAQAQPKIYAYGGTANYCPSGLQPITLDGVICCGTPNQSMSYQQVKAHPVTKRKVVRRETVHYMAAPATVYCPEGSKGCYTQ
ncbi:MAG: hypothetical protein CSA70_07290 [Rhodobacterales bacterium]|nr:MAG: hypothetical protein CSA70_07290 [Rhodobacterales bacterium]